MMPNTNAAPIETMPFDNQPGIFFENLGPSGIISSEWTLIAYYNMELYWKEFEHLNNYHNRLEEVCNLIHQPSDCRQINNQFQHLIKELTQNNELLTLPQKGRTKRGAINLIGNLANTLFGVLDSEYANEMAITISKVEQNEMHLSELLKNQTSLIDATINVIKRNEETRNQHLNQLEQQISRISLDVNQTHKELYQTQLSQLFASIAIQTLLLTSDFCRIQNAIIDVMVNTQHGKVNPQLLPPSQLNKEISKIKAHLPPSLKLPTAPDDVLSFYNLMHIEGRTGANYIIFKITLPLLSADNLELFHVIPVPVKVNNTFIAIQPSFPYLLLNLFRDQYYPMTEQELSSCIAMREEKIICKQRRPMYRNGSSVSNCEINFMNQAKQSPACRLARIEGGPHWIQLHAANQWIYALHEKTTLNVVCGKNVTQINLNKSGLLKMQPGCVIKQQLFTLQAHDILPSITRISYIPATNISEMLVPNYTIMAVHQQHHYDTHLIELDEIKTNLMKMKIELPATLNNHDIHHYSMTSFSLLVIIVVICYFTWKKCRAKVRDPREEAPSFATHKTAQTSIMKPEDSSSHRENQLTDADFTINIEHHSG